MAAICAAVGCRAAASFDEGVGLAARLVFGAAGFVSAGRSTGSDGAAAAGATAGGDDGADFAGGGAAAAGFAGAGIAALTAVLQAGESLAILRSRHCRASRPPG